MIGNTTNKTGTRYPDMQSLQSEVQIACCKRKRCSKTASESKRRCLSSLEFSPLNLSLLHPCKLFQQTHTIQQRTKESWHFCSFSAVLHKLQESWVQQLFQAYMAMVESRFAGEAYSKMTRRNKKRLRSRKPTWHRKITMFHRWCIFKLLFFSMVMLIFGGEKMPATDPSVEISHWSVFYKPLDPLRMLNKIAFNHPKVVELCMNKK